MKFLCRYFSCTESSVSPTRTYVLDSTQNSIAFNPSDAVQLLRKRDYEFSSSLL